MLNNVLVILNVDSNYQYIVKGLVILAAVLLDQASKKKGH
jgi:ABC-type xylose transport system permease subunit